MFDFKKPLDGVPGLLLLAALVLFGATIGVSLALVFSWVEMKDSLANFLGGVVGAGLGAALAVMGAIYVQRGDVKLRLRAPLNTLYTRLISLSAELLILHFNVTHIWPDDDEVRKRLYRTVTDGFSSVERQLGELPHIPELARQMNESVAVLKVQGTMHVRAALRDATGVTAKGAARDAIEVRRPRALAALTEVSSLLRELVEDVRADLG